MPDAFIEFLLNARSPHGYSRPLHAVRQLGGFSCYLTFPTRVIGEIRSEEAGPKSHRCTPMTPANVCADYRGVGTSGPYPCFWEPQVLGVDGQSPPGLKSIIETWQARTSSKEGSLNAEQTFPGREVQRSQARQDRHPRRRALQVQRPGGLKQHSLGTGVGRGGGDWQIWAEEGVDTVSALGRRGLLRVGGEHP